MVPQTLPLAIKMVSRNTYFHVIKLKLKLFAETG
jgi:hypothetical protein